MKKVKNNILLLVCTVVFIFLFVSTAPADDTIFTNENPGGVVASPSSPSSPTQFTLNAPMIITYLRTYHWNNGRGQSAGSISLKSSTGQSYGPWTASIYNNFYWVVKPNICLPAGTYTIVDTYSSTWSYNSQSGNKGFATVNTDPCPDDVKGPIKSMYNK